MTLIPNGEKVVADYLRTHSAVAPLCTRVTSKAPDNRDTAWIRYHQLNATKEPKSRPEWLITFLLQLDCYAGKTGGQPEASLLARTVRAALLDMPTATLADAVVSRVAIVSMPRLPDTAMEPARERFVITANVQMRSR